ncbi:MULTISPECIES: stage VI sporulation protein D [unclassified Bacillus (in: firmicutes)]|uniref:stage VI sporulation protein D n=1 Tax=unclassified Bacillus (in: firmicutes) TaxID=185979 RepID=UPI0008EA21CD|nr:MULTISPECIES: stage VI sporulation protein D [unclassified Bacillus (in: firmicutes)]SFB16446.1 stage VI sporulation protein D [Bacillus sp. UNCCL13]SFQ78031.1 stage VI sporulation protein D [Bacillus sp. cl95]
MSQGNQSCLRFSLEESVWFQKGQEVAELVSVSLDPDIVIQESDQYVTISGSLQLTGEYRRHEDVALEGDYVTAQKFVQNVEHREDGIYEFSHRFPVDITIPYNRIQSIYDVDVAVESFDYVFPERSCLKLNADLTISGLYGDQQHEPAEEVEAFEPIFRSIDVEVEEEAAEADTEPSEFENVYLPFEAEARKRLEEEVKKAEVKVPILPVQETANEQEQEQEAVVSQPRGEVQKPQPVNQVPVPSVVEEVPQAELPVVEEIPQAPPVAEKQAQPQEEYEEESSSSADKNNVSQASPDVKKKKASKKTGMSLTEFFARKEDAEEHVKLKVCIVQKGDTLDSLSERYEVSLQNLLRYNQLELNQDVYEGQVLYIPASYAKN